MPCHTFTAQAVWRGQDGGRPSTHDSNRIDTWLEIQYSQLRFSRIQKVITPCMFGCGQTEVMRPLPIANFKDQHHAVVHTAAYQVLHATAGPALDTSRGSRQDQRALSSDKLSAVGHGEKVCCWSVCCT